MENDLDLGRNAAIIGQAVQYNLTNLDDDHHNREPQTRVAMHADLDQIEIYHVIASGRLTVPGLDLVSYEYQEAITMWHRELQDIFQAWMEEDLQERYEENRIRTPIEYG